MKIENENQKEEIINQYENQNQNQNEIGYINEFEDDNIIISSEKENNVTYKNP